MRIEIPNPSFNQLVEGDCLISTLTNTVYTEWKITTTQHTHRQHIIGMQAIELPYTIKTIEIGEHTLTDLGNFILVKEVQLPSEVKSL